MGTLRQEIGQRVFKELDSANAAELAFADSNIEQIEVESDLERPKRGRGGKRHGAGRKKTGVRRGGPHRRRPDLNAAHPVHVTLRMDRRRPELRNHHVYKQADRVLRAYLGRDDVRICHVSIQQNHLHLLVEAADRFALTRCMKGFSIRLQRAVRERYGCKLFSHRYHAKQIKTARQARNSLAYVLNNWRRHRLDWDDRGRLSTAKLDEFSSAISFDGWRGFRFEVPRGYQPLSVSKPRTWLLAVGWRDCGLIDPFETPRPFD